MLLRPFYPIDYKLGKKINCTELASLLINITSSNIRKKILCYLNIRQLIIILKAITKDEKNDDFYNFNELDENLKSIWIDIVDVLNNFPCVKLVDSYNNNNCNDDDNSSNIVKEDNNDWFELSIDSNEYDFLLEYLFDSKFNKIIFPLIEIGTKKFNKIFEVLDNHCINIKIENDKISVIKDSKNFKSKLKILTLINYEHFETVEKLNYETLNIIGNEVDLFSISTIIEKNKDLKIIYFNGRLKDYIPLHINENIKVYYNLIVFDTIDQNQLKSLGNLNRINSLYLNFTLESNLTFNWLLNNCNNLEKLYFSLNFDSINSIQIIENINNLSELKELTLKNCKILMKEDFNSLMLTNLNNLTLIDCEIDSKFLNSIYNQSIISISLINCDINYKSFIKISNYIKNLTIINKDVEQCKDLFFLTFKKRSSFKISTFNTCLLNINEKYITIKIPESHDIFFTKINDFNYNNKIINLNNLEIPFNSTIYFSIYPIFNNINFEFLKKLIKKYDVYKTVIELYSFTNEFFQIFNIEKNIKNLKIYHYDLFKLQNYLKKLLSKKELDLQDKHFFLPYECSYENNAILSMTSKKTLQSLKHSRSIRRTSDNSENNFKRARINKNSNNNNNNNINNSSINTTSTNTTNNNNKGKQINGGKNKNITMINGKRVHTCLECGKYFSRSTALNRHSLVHKNHRPFKCDSCGYCFKRSDHLKVHKRICTNK